MVFIDLEGILQCFYDALNIRDKHFYVESISWLVIIWLRLRAWLIAVGLLRWWVSSINLTSHLLLLSSVTLDWITNLSNYKIVEWTSSLSDSKPFGVISKPVRNETVLSSAKETASTSIITASKMQSARSSHNFHFMWETAHGGEEAEGKSKTSVMVALTVPYALVASESLSH